METFRKTAAQIDAIKKIAESPAKNVMLMGGARAGKTVLAIFILIIRASLCKSSHIIVRATFNSVKNSIWMETLPFVLRVAFPKLKYTWDRTNYILKLTHNGSTIRCAGLDDGDKMERLLGLEFSTILAEECNQIPWNAIQKLKTRLAEKNKLAKKVFYTQNPTTKTSAYYQVFEKGLDPLSGSAFDEDELSNYLSIRINPESNIENLDEDFLKMLEKLPENERNRFLLGEYSDESDGQVYYAFRREKHVRKTSKIPGTCFIGMDFNVDPSTAIILQVIDDTIHVQECSDNLLPYL